MADRKKKRAYLDDFEKDLNGNYQYRGAHYHYKGTKSRGRALAGLWVLCGGGAALVVAAGLVPGATAYAPFWLLLPYMAGLLAAVFAAITAAAQLVQLALEGQNLPARLVFTLLQAAAAAAFVLASKQFKALKYERQE